MSTDFDLESGAAQAIYLDESDEPVQQEFQALVDDGRDVALVVTRPDKRRGRGGEQRIAVRAGAGDQFAADIPGSSGTVVDHDGLAQLRGALSHGVEAAQAVSVPIGPVLPPSAVPSAPPMIARGVFGPTSDRRGVRPR